MKKFYTLIILCLIALNLQAQAIYKTLDSYKLGDERELKIQLPRNYSVDSESTYPLIIVLDGDYLFEPVAGNIDYQAYWESIPDCIVVGINQVNTRKDDFIHNIDGVAVTEENNGFYDFINVELLPYIEENYKVSSFKIIIGHDLGANFINYYLFEDSPIFRAFISLSPDLVPEMVNKLQERLSVLQQETFYYLATADADLKALRNDIIECDAKLKSIENEKLNYMFDNFNDANHYSLVGRGIPRALNEIFQLYKPISREEYKEKILTSQDSPYEYLIKKYENMAYFYGFEKTLIENDIRAIAAASNKKDDIESLEKLAILVNEKFPRSMLSAYYMGMFHERDGNLKKALLKYKSGLLLEPSQYIDKEIMLDKMYEVQDAMKN